MRQQPKTSHASCPPCGLGVLCFSLYRLPRVSFPRQAPSDYEGAKQWMCQLLEALKLSAEALFICPGNHDLDRDIAQFNARPNTPEEADQVLGGFSIPEHFQKPFGAFAD